jgi:leucyl aminopeptidase
MKLTSLSLLALSVTAINARFLEKHETDQVVLNDAPEQLYLVELEPGKTQWITEEDKWELRRVRTASDSNTTPVLTRL